MFYRFVCVRVCVDTVSGWAFTAVQLVRKCNSSFTQMCVFLSGTTAASGSGRGSASWDVLSVRVQGFPIQA